MKLIEKLKDINHPKVKNLVEGDYGFIKEFWDNVIVPNLLSDDTIRAYHKLIVNYIKLEKPTLAMSD